MNKRIYSIVTVLIVIVVGSAAWQFFYRNKTPLGVITTGSEHIQNKEKPPDDPVDVVMDFYGKWLSATQSTSTDPYRSGLATAPVLTTEVSARLKSMQGTTTVGIDSVFCQASIPEKIGAKVIFKLAQESQVLIISTGRKMPGQATVSLKATNGKWQISDISCTSGESAPSQEFTYEGEGNLLKSVPPPLNPNYWYLVYEERGQKGNTIQLAFDAKSRCTAFDGSENVCDPSTLVQAIRASIKGDMTEIGVTVRKLRILEKK